jgi:hypothetical protein
MTKFAGNVHVPVILIEYTESINSMREFADPINESILNKKDWNTPTDPGGNFGACSAPLD